MPDRVSLPPHALEAAANAIGEDEGIHRPTCEALAEACVSAFLFACSDRDLAQMGLLRFDQAELGVVITVLDRVKTVRSHDGGTVNVPALLKARGLVRAALGAGQEEDG